MPSQGDLELGITRSVVVAGTNEAALRSAELFATEVMPAFTAVA